MSITKIYFISVNPFGLLPLMRYIIPLFNKNSTEIIHTYVDGTYQFNQYGTQKNIQVYENIHDLNNQTIFQRLYKYAKIIGYLINVVIKNKQAKVYTVDYQVVAFVLFLKRIFNNRLKLIYHQFELFEPSNSKGINRILQEKVLMNGNRINLAIFPEVNRSEYFFSYSKKDGVDVLLIPNTNKLSHDVDHSASNEILSYADKTVIAHIGSTGSDHYTSKYIEFIMQSNNPDLVFLFIGNIDYKIAPLLNELAFKDKRVIIINQIPHKDLMKYYKTIDIGIILYKGVDKNNEYCAPNKLYEYWSHGIPVIAHKLTGLKTIWKHQFQGELIDFNNLNEFENAIDKIQMHKVECKKTLRDYFEKELSIDRYLPVLIDRINNL